VPKFQKVHAWNDCIIASLIRLSPQLVTFRVGSADHCSTEPRLGESWLSLGTCTCTEHLGAQPSVDALHDSLESNSTESGPPLKDSRAPVAKWSEIRRRFHGHQDPRNQNTAASTLLHADLHERNIFVSDDDPTIITGLIDCQSSNIEPEFCTQTKCQISQPSFTSLHQKINPRKSTLNSADRHLMLA